MNILFSLSTSVIKQNKTKLKNKKNYISHRRHHRHHHPPQQLFTKDLVFFFFFILLLNRTLSI